MNLIFLVMLMSRHIVSDICVAPPVDPRVRFGE